MRPPDSCPSPTHVAFRGILRWDPLGWCFTKGGQGLRSPRLQALRTSGSGDALTAAYLPLIAATRDSPETTAQSYLSGENSPDSLGHRPRPFLPSIFSALFCLLGPAVQQFVLLFTCVWGLAFPVRLHSN